MPDPATEPQRSEALAARPKQLQRSGLTPAQARLCMTIVEAAATDTARHVIERWTIVDGGWVHTYNLESQRWESWPREAVHWIEWLPPDGE